MVPRRGNNLSQTLACRAYKQALSRSLWLYFRNLFRNQHLSAYHNAPSKQGRS